MNKTIKVSNAELLGFVIPAFIKMKESVLPTRVSYKVIKTLASCTMAGADYDKERFEIIEQKCKKDENGKPVFDEKNNYLFDSDEISNSVYTEIEGLLKREVEVVVYPISIEDIPDVSLQTSVLESLIKMNLITE
jgi:hypothetical protein